MSSLKPKTLISIGLVLMALRNVLQTVADRSGHSADWSDFLLGILMGLGIALALLGLWRNGRRGHSSGACSR